MEVKEKAIELVEKYRVESWVISRDHDKECALIAVNEILDSNMIHLHLHQMDYWGQVKIEIKKL